MMQKQIANIYKIAVKETPKIRLRVPKRSEKPSHRIYFIYPTID